MKALLIVSLSWVLAGCYSTYTTADGTVCKQYKPMCGFLTDDDLLICEFDDNGCEICSCASTTESNRSRADHESGRNGYWEPQR